MNTVNNIRRGPFLYTLLKRLITLYRQLQKVLWLNTSHGDPQM